MKTKLFDELIFGPILSRRLGFSLGINLLPNEYKICNFDCIYCECGWTNLKQKEKVAFHSQKDTKKALEIRLVELTKKGTALNSITFAGNGEPTMHPHFLEIILDTIELRNLYFPSTKISVLSNSLMLGNKSVRKALELVDLRILKLDAGSDSLFQKINQPLNNRNLDWVTDHLKRFDGNCTIQTLFLRGEHNGSFIDNTIPNEVEYWLQKLIEINPKEVMIYSIDRPTPESRLEKIPLCELEEIAQKVRLAGLNVAVY